MGGINHQPCNKKAPANYLFFSTQMSRAMSIARSQFELANVNLEDVLLFEMGKRPPAHLEGSKAFLDASVTALRDMQTALGGLRANMKEVGYVDLPSLRYLPLEDRGSEFTSLGIVDKTQWNAVVATMKDGSFYAVLDVFEKYIKSIRRQTEALGVAMVALSARQGDVTDVLERNLDGNIKVPFAQLYREWCEFQVYFLSSSMLSTELWYAQNQHGSLSQSHKTAVA